MWRILERGRGGLFAFPPPPHVWAVPKMPIVNRVKIWRYSVFFSILFLRENNFCKIKAQRWGIIQLFLLKKGVASSFPQLLSAWFIWKKFPFITFSQLSLLVDITSISDLQSLIRGTKVTLQAFKYNAIMKFKILIKRKRFSYFLIVFL